MTRDMWDMTYDRGEHYLKTSDPDLIRFWRKVVFEDFEEKDHSLTKSIDYKGVYRTRLHQVC